MPRNKLINGAHAIIYSRKPEADRAFLRDLLGLSHVDAGGGWLIFALPSAELAVHPSSKNNLHELYFMCPNVDEFAAAMKNKRISCSPVQTLSWGKRIQIRLPGGGKLGVYQPLHARPKAARQHKPEGRRTAHKVR
jgi:hypothetical protein